MVRFNPELEAVLRNRVNISHTGQNAFLRDAHGQLWLHYDAMTVASHTSQPDTTVLTYWLAGKHVVSLDVPGSIGPNTLVVKGVNALIALDEASVAANAPALQHADTSNQH